MIVALDVDYRVTSVVTAIVTFDDWTAASAARESVIRTPGEAAAYEPGKFYERELPYLRGALATIEQFDLVIVDGFVWLGADRKGLGAHLADVIGTPVVGVAKTYFEGAPAIEVLRGSSANPLYVTATGIDAAVAASHVKAMHGEFRIPTLLKRADSLSKG
ncbi:MAG: endonuclease V [Kofleriaceae bacterium]